MKKFTLKFGAILLAFTSFGQAEVAPKKVSLNFYRPSVANVFISSTSSEVNKVFKSFEKLPVEKRFDQRNIKTKYLSITKPVIPTMPENVDPLELKKVIKEVQAQRKAYDSICLSLVYKSLKKVSTEMVGDQWSRDAKGNFNFDKIMEAAKYSATDNQALVSSSSKDKLKVYTDIASELMKRNFIVVYDISSVKTYEQFYNEQDARAQALAAKTGKPATPVKRTLEGWMINFDVKIFKVIWNDSVQVIFDNDLYIDESMTENRSSRISAFDNFDFPVELVYTGSASATSSQSNNPETYNKPFSPKRLTMDELLAELPSSMQESSMFKASKQIDDFRVKAPIFSEKPITAKLGSKEGIYIDQRMFAYEIEQDEQGNQVKKRKGVLRPSKIVNNDTIAEGESLASTFRQQGGKKLYNGMLVEMKEDWGIGVNLGYGILDNVVGGINGGVELRLARYTKGILPDNINRLLRGWHLNINASFNMFNDKNFFADSSVQSFIFGGASKGSVITYGGSLSRETYFTKKGNLYVMPEFGAGLASLTISGQGENQLIGSSLYINGGIGIGFHFGPSLSLFAKPCFNMRLGYDWVDQNEVPLTGVEELEKSSDWGFDKLNNFSTPVYVGLRLKF
jgi:hypothetical protein